MLPHVVIFCPHFPHESSSGGIAALRRRPRLPRPCLEAGERSTTTTTTTTTDNNNDNDNDNNSDIMLLVRILILILLTLLMIAMTEGHWRHSEAERHGAVLEVPGPVDRRGRRIL